MGNTQGRPKMLRNFFSKPWDGGMAAVENNNSGLYLTTHIEAIKGRCLATMGLLKMENGKGNEYREEAAQQLKQQIV